MFMTRRQILIICLLSLFLHSQVSQAQQTKQQFECPMKCEGKKFDATGSCPVCKMDLITCGGTTLKPSLLKRLPQVRVTDLKGNGIDLSTLSNGGKPFVVMFWFSWCAPCLKEMTNVAEVYDEWKGKTGVKIFAVNVDDARSSAKVPAFVQGKRWSYELLLDKNQDAMRAFNFNMPPFTVLLDGNGNISWIHSSYMDGDEDELGEKIEALVKK